MRTGPLAAMYAVKYRIHGTDKLTGMRTEILRTVYRYTEFQAKWAARNAEREGAWDISIEEPTAEPNVVEGVIM